MNGRILLASDDVQLRALLRELLAAHGFDVDAVDVSAPLSLRSAVAWDASILDAAASDRATRWLRTLHATARVPTIALARAPKGMIAECLWNSVDVVLHAPLDARKLMLTLRGLFVSRSGPAAHENHELTVGPLTLHSLVSTAVLEGREIALTGVETLILRELMLAPSVPVSRERLTRWRMRSRWSPDDRGLDTHMKRLRSKLGQDRQGRSPIRTVRGIGYLLLAQWQPARPPESRADSKVQTTSRYSSLP